MHPVIQKTVGGLSAACYGRHFFFGCIFLAVFLFVGATMGLADFATWVAIFVNTFLYPYSRFAYESAVGFIFGKNVFIVNAAIFLFVKVVTMMMCWWLAMLIAPLGLAYLYFYHSGKLR